MRRLFSEMILIYSFFLVFDSLIPILSTMLRTFGMNTHASVIIFLAFGFPFILQNYVYVVYMDLENFSPIISLLVCNVFIFFSGIFFIFKNTKKNLNQIIEDLRKKKRLKS